MTGIELKSNRQIIRETATAFSEVCSSVLEKAVDSKGVFNTVMDFVQNMNRSRRIAETLCRYTVLRTSL
jgi:hypothetical protein